MMIRSTVKKLMHRTGVLRRMARRDARRVAILLYHGLRRADGDPLRQEGDHKFTSVDVFERQVCICKDYGTVVPLADVVSGAPLPANATVVTFDDGYANNWSLAFPLLKRYQVPATVFLSTGFLDGQTFLWMDWFEHLVAKAPGRVWNAELGGKPVCLDLRNGEARARTREEVKNQLKREPIAEVHRFLTSLQNLWEVPYRLETISEPLRPLRWDQVREMEKSGLVDFGAHTVAHAVLSRCDRARQEREIHDSKRRIEEELGRPCVAFAYPNGRAEDFSAETVEVVRGCGFLAAVTTLHGFVRPPAPDPLRLPRWGAPRTETDLAYLLAR